jgi:hypothetical protein
MKKATVLTTFVAIAFFAANFTSAQYGGGGGGGNGPIVGSGGGPNNSFLQLGAVSNDAFVIAQKQNAGNIIAGGTGTGSGAGGKCSTYITTYNRLGRTGGEYQKLVSFLNKYEGANLSGNTFTPATAAAVKKFQAKYGVTPNSGHQLGKTTKKINELYCKFVGF